MSAVIIAILITTGACAFMFFVLPYLDSRKADNSSDKESGNSGVG